MNIKDAIKEYQCNGCINPLNGIFPTCFIRAGSSSSCKCHNVGTSTNYGRFFLGLPVGFNRLGKIEDQKINIFESEKQFLENTTMSIVDGIDIANSLYNKLNVPCWKYLDEFGSTIVRGLSPRINSPFIDIFLFDARDKIHCIEITKDIIDQID